MVKIGGVFYLTREMFREQKIMRHRAKIKKMQKNALKVLGILKRLTLRILHIVMYISIKKTASKPVITFVFSLFELVAVTIIVAKDSMHTRSIQINGTKRAARGSPYP